MSGAAPGGKGGSRASQPVVDPEAAMSPEAEAAADAQGSHKTGARRPAPQAAEESSQALRVTPPVWILLLAAGASSRMRGRDKLAEPVDGQPLLRRQAQAALATGAPVVVVLPCPEGPRGALLDGLPALRLPAPESALGMGHSIAAGARVADRAGAGGLMVLNADLPEIGTAEIAATLAAHTTAPQRIHRGTSAEGEAGHPVLFPAHLLPELAQLDGDSGAKALVRREGFLPVPLPGRAAVLDLDTPEDWAAWRAARG